VTGGKDFSAYSPPYVDGYEIRDNCLVAYVHILVRLDIGNL